ncbi:MAG: UDP-N-acetylmuramoyl-L-alanyl-D-glutamate--2,6-diaminopimelate ligase [Chloroflexi bacterium]|nr:UDP-N-acetylmuramoyl-L-alanyl-D-glutamate--2,6-diaminopimelate ligase [Chloroflexota bacterium]
MNLSTLLPALPAYQIENARDCGITRVTDKSSQVIPGALFVAIPGINVDGAQFIPDAIQRGAVAVVTQSPLTTYHLSLSNLIRVPNARTALAHLCAAFHDFPSRKLRVIGITGTDGKTTTCTLAASILAAAGHTVGAITTVGATIGDDTLDTGFHTTTPDSPAVQNYLAQMIEAETEYAIIEATSEGLAQNRLDAVEFDVAVITNITHEHLYYHKTWENYRDAKAMLFRSLATAFRKPRTAKIAVLNADDTARGVFDFLRAIPADEQIIYSANPTYHLPLTCTFIQAREAIHSPRGLAFTVETPFGELEIESPLIGRYNVANILAAIGVGMARRVPFDAMRAGIARVRGVPGRMELIQRGQPFAVIVDFAHTPNALSAALDTAREISRGRVIVVFGCAGLRDVAKRAMMGEIAGQLADQIILTAEDPRTESLDAINAQIIEGLQRAGRREHADYFIINDRGDAIARAIQIARAGDVVLIAGKGHERSMCFGTTEFPWSDQEAVIAALK